jgi:hypothetical protein
MRQSIALVSSLLLTFAFAGCAAQTVEDPSEAAASEDELSTAAKPLVGAYSTPTPTLSGFARLDLKSDGHYDAKINWATMQLCVTEPCYGSQSGRWSAFHQGGALKVRITPQGQTGTVYTAVKTYNLLTLTANGVTQKLAIAPAGKCNNVVDCNAGETCLGPQYCLMYCLADDPSCCGPGTCVAPKPPVQNDAGAGTDAGETCGNNVCGAGEVCCNPLDGICTPPGWACTQ